MSDPLDIEQHDQLVGYLRATGRIERDETPQVRTLAGGVSNRTVLVKRPSGEAWVLKQALAKLRVKVDWFSDPARVHREALGLQWLEKLAPPGMITPLAFKDEAHHLLAMQAVPEPHENWKTMLLAGRLDFDHLKQFARLLATIHRESSKSPQPLAEIFDDRSFFESLRIEPYYQFAASQAPEAAEFIEKLIDDTRATRVSIVHGDYSPKNILVRDGRLVLLDHEVIHWGDPAFDIGFALTHLLSKAHHLPQHRRDFWRAAIDFWIYYEWELGDTPWSTTLHDRASRHTLACLLARVAGRSPLEYLDDMRRARQREVVIRMINEEVWTNVGAVIPEFVTSVEDGAD
jgi:aminoglycoside phosphotransferase (APT) family kinase protein